MIHRWAVAIQSKELPFEFELGSAICRCLREMGHDALLVEDGSPQGLEAQALLLIVNLGNFPDYCRRLSRVSKCERPIVILWQMDPLPPEDIPADAERAGLRAAVWNDFFNLNQPAGEMPRRKTFRAGVRLREWAGKQISAPGYRHAFRLMRRAGAAKGDFDWRQIRGVMRNWRAILEAYRAAWIDHFVMSTNQRRRFLAGRSIQSHFAPVGAYEELGRDLGLHRDIQAGFLGNIKHGRRAKLLERLGAQLARRGIRLTQVVADCHGEKRCEWLNRTRILINLHNFPWNPAWIRFLMAAACGALVVTEPMNDEHPMIEGEHYVAAPVEKMPEAVEELLDDPPTVLRITRSAARLCRETLTLMNSVEHVCSIANRRSEWVTL